MADPVHERLFLEVELPAIYVKDIPKLMAELGLDPHQTESEFILNCIGEPSGCKLTVEVSGNKDSEVMTVWGMVQGARLDEASKGYGPHLLTEDEIEESWSDRLDGPAEEAIDLAVERLQAIDGISDEDIAADLRHQLRLVEARLERAALPQFSNQEEGS